MLADPDLLVQNLPLLEPSLGWVQSTWAGVDAFFKTRPADAPPVDWAFTRLAGTFGDLMAEYVIGQIIARERGFAVMQSRQGNSNWDRTGVAQYRPLRLLTIGILGYGDIGSVVAARAKAMGMCVHVFRRSEAAADEGNVDRVFRQGSDSLPEFLSTADYVVNLLPSTPHTRGILSGEALRACEGRQVSEAALLTSKCTCPSHYNVLHDRRVLLMLAAATS